MEHLNYNYLDKYIDQLRSKGRYTFTLAEVKSYFKVSENAIKIGLQRLRKKGRTRSVYKGFYIIIPPEYSAHGVLPAIQFIDDLMHHLEKPYYVGLLSAAAMHGAAHQRPQESYVITVRPVQRPLLAAGVKINFMVKSKIPATGLVQKKTLTGYVNVSSPELTAIDLLLCVNRIGGMNRVATMLQELCEVLDPAKFHEVIDDSIPIAVIQRLGYLMEYELEFQSLADRLYEVVKSKIKRHNLLHTAKKGTSSKSRNRWKINVNTQIETDL
ncbi:MAG: type IV toxin-antitoxin system AbiEi family antitoxin [Candidatus Marinimicrobia bacterium]|nr:type IV toxin-antitoxin system AbiEi family antitoxin [bacterium]MCG2715609.1 type IV toxin-antitoxin system AbiEi family antitoxin [Candidatus Neomarinimicrobiota bacterium]